MLRLLKSVLLAVWFAAGAVAAQEQTVEALDGGLTPPRLSLTDGDASFLRPGARDWVPARLNTPLAPGDQLYAGKHANLEIQIGPSAFLRARGESQVGFENHDATFLQFSLSYGRLALDLTSLGPLSAIELDAPNAVITIEHPGYYRLETEVDRTTFTARRSGRATVSTAGRQAFAVEAGQQVVVTGLNAPFVQTAAAPEMDAWDRWNDLRTDTQIDTVSSRYVPDQVYGRYDLDYYGDWREVAPYGAVWVPWAVRSGWAPYSAGHWLWDPYFGWTWVDDLPWGWAPFHYGRWIYLHDYWAWTPGHFVKKPHYAPALVAFFRRGHGAGQFRFTVPDLSWVALGWGEPCVPWWGPQRFRRKPHWLGWGGPRVINKKLLGRDATVEADALRAYRNAEVPKAVVEVKGDDFGRRSVHQVRLRDTPDIRKLEPVRGEVPISADPTRLLGDPAKAVRPADPYLDRRILATRRPQRDAQATTARLVQGTGTESVRPRVILVPPPDRFSADATGRRRTAGVEAVRARPALAPSLRDGAGGGLYPRGDSELRRPPPGTRIESSGDRRGLRRDAIDPSRPETTERRDDADRRQGLRRDTLPAAGPETPTLPGERVSPPQQGPGEPRPIRPAPFSGERQPRYQRNVAPISAPRRMIPELQRQVPLAPGRSLERGGGAPRSGVSRGGASGRGGMMRGGGRSQHR